MGRNFWIEGKSFDSYFMEEVLNRVLLGIYHTSGDTRNGRIPELSRYWQTDLPSFSHLNEEMLFTDLLYQHGGESICDVLVNFFRGPQQQQRDVLISTSKQLTSEPMSFDTGGHIEH